MYCCVDVHEIYIYIYTWRLKWAWPWRFGYGISVKTYPELNQFAIYSMVSVILPITTRTSPFQGPSIDSMVVQMQTWNILICLMLRLKSCANVAIDFAVREWRLHVSLNKANFDTFAYVSKLPRLSHRYEPIMPMCNYLLYSHFNHPIYIHISFALVPEDKYNIGALHIHYCGILGEQN